MNLTAPLRDLVLAIRRPETSRSGPRAGAARVFEFSEDRYWTGGPTLVAVGPAEVVKAQFSEDDLLRTFGSYVAYVDEGDGRFFLGVWHAPRIEHFYRALRTRGVSTQVSKERPPKLRLLRRSGV